jgi:hypothetical protein
MLASRPHFIPVPRPRSGSTVSKGLAYQKRWLRHCETLAGLAAGPFSHRLFTGIKRNDLEFRPEQWFIYADSNGIGYAEADLVIAIKPARIVLLFENKRTHKDRGLVQLGQLYRPLLEFVYPGFAVFGLLVCRNLDPSVNRRYLVASLQDWFDLLEAGLIAGTEVPLYSLCWRP